MTTLDTASNAVGSHRRAVGRRRRVSVGRVASWAILWFFVLLTILPFYWMLRISLSTDRSLASDPGSLLPVDFTLGGFKRVLGLSSLAEAQAEGGSGASINFWLYLRNSMIVSTASSLGQVFFCGMAAYAFARMRWPGRNKVFGVFLASLLVPAIFISLPNFLTVKSLGLLNTLPGIVAPTFLMTPFAIFFLRQFFLGLPKEVDDSAKIDGAGHFTIFFRLILPMSKPPVITLAILQFIGTWNDYFWPLIAGQTEGSRVLTVALSVFKSQTPQGSPDWAGLMAATLVAALPIMIIYFIFGRRIIDSIGFTGVK
jgi:multiple sugar transport system permease protein